MNREIKFKTIVQYDDGRIEYYFVHPFNESLDSEQGRELMPLGAKHLAVGLQYTGLKDKNGKEIYEGDIVKSDNKFYSESVAVVKWLNNRCGFYYVANTIGTDIINREPYQSAYKINSVKVEVIGNIYENPELI